MPVRRGEEGANWLVAIMSGRERKGRWRVGRNLKVINIMGGSDLDLNDAELADDDVDDHRLRADGRRRHPRARRPQRRAHGLRLHGRQRLDLGDERPDPGGPTLQMRVISIMGGTDVKRGRKLTRAERKARST